MDWFTWLSKTDVDPSLVYEYALIFTHNELVEDDMTYFSHDFLQSMGVSIAKHRLEILKLARKKKKNARKIIHPVVWIMFVYNQTKNYVSKHVHTLIHRNQDVSLSLAPKRNHSLRWKVAMLQRNKRLKATSLGHDGVRSPMFVSGDGVLMLTNGSPMVESRSLDGSSRSGSSWVESEGNGESGRFSTDEIKWDLMFRNLNPT